MMSSDRGICHLGLKGFSGSIVLRSQPLRPAAYALAHSDIAPIEDQVRNMESAHISAIASGFIFAKRQAVEMLDGSGCGFFSLQYVLDPLKWPTNSTSKFDRPCYLSQQTQCPDFVKDD